MVRSVFYGLDLTLSISSDSVDIFAYSRHRGIPEILITAKELCVSDNLEIFAPSIIFLNV